MIALLYSAKVLVTVPGEMIGVLASVVLRASIGAYRRGSDGTQYDRSLYLLFRFKLLSL